MAISHSAAGEYSLWHGAIGLDGRRFCSPDRRLVEGRGVRVRDAGGRWLLDSRSSLRTLTFGYSYEPIVEAIRRQVDQLPYAEIVRHDRPSAVVIELADRLIDALGEHYTRVRLTTSGSRMVEEAVIVARFAAVSGDGRPERTHVIANEDAWHGLGGIATAATGDSVIWDWAGPLGTDFHHVPPNDIAALDKAIADIGTERLLAILIEPINGVGAVFLQPEYTRAIAERCRQHDLFLISDEVTTAVGRAGYMSYSGELGLVPDILVLGKGLTSGYVPISALAVNERVYQKAMNAWPRVVPHSSTNDGNPLAAAAGIAVLDALSDGKIFRHVREAGAMIGERLAEFAAGPDLSLATRGTGFMHFIDLGPDCDRTYMYHLAALCEDRGLLIDYAQGRYVVFTPPLISTVDELTEMLDILTRSIKDLTPP